MKKIAFIIILPLLFSCINEKKNFWKDTSELQGTWVNLERDRDGYLIYNPCDAGYKSSIVVNESEIIYGLGHEPDSLKISAIKILNSLDEVEILGKNEYHSITSIMKKIDSDKNLYLFKWELTPKNESMEIKSGKMMMTRKEFVNNFRFIDNPCDSEKVPEKIFLPVEY